MKSPGSKTTTMHTLRSISSLGIPTPVSWTTKRAHKGVNLIFTIIPPSRVYLKAFPTSWSNSVRNMIKRTRNTHLWDWIRPSPTFRDRRRLQFHRQQSSQHHKRKVGAFNNVTINNRNRPYVYSISFFSIILRNRAARSAVNGASLTGLNRPTSFPPSIYSPFSILQFLNRSLKVVVPWRNPSMNRLVGPIGRHSSRQDWACPWCVYHWQLQALHWADHQWV